MVHARFEYYKVLLVTYPYVIINMVMQCANVVDFSSDSNTKGNVNTYNHTIVFVIWTSGNGTGVVNNFRRLFYMSTLKVWFDLCAGVCRGSYSKGKNT